MHNIETIVCELIQAPSVARHGFKSRHFRRGDGPIDRANAHSGPIQSLSVAGPIFRRSPQIQNSTRLVLLKDFRNDSNKKLESTLAKSVIQPIGTKVFARIDHSLLRSPRDRVSHPRSSISITFSCHSLAQCEASLAPTAWPRVPGQPIGPTSPVVSMGSSFSILAQ